MNKEIYLFGNVEDKELRMFKTDEWMSLIINVLSDEITKAAYANQSRMKEMNLEKRNKLFESKYGTVPLISMNAFMWRAVDLLYRCPTVYLLAGYYLQKYLNLKYDELLLSPTNMHRLFVAAYCCSALFCNDTEYTTRAFARTFGITRKEVSDCTMEFLTTFKFNCYISHEQYVTFAEKIQYLRSSQIRGMLLFPLQTLLTPFLNGRLL